MKTAQAPINSGFSARTTAAQALEGIDLRGKVAIVTGGSAGIGLETTRVLAEKGAVVIVPARNPEKAERALEGIPNVEQFEMELMDPVSIDAFAGAIVSTGRPVHMLINNAGIMATPLFRDARGYESQFSANHLGHFQLTLRLLPALRAARGARVISLSSRGHQRGQVDFDDPNFDRRPYDRWQAYGQSKTANILFAVEMDRLGEASGIRAFSLHPGAIVTDLAVNLTDDEIKAYGFTRDAAPGSAPPGRSVDEGGDFKSIAQGAATTVWCATSPRLNGMGGVYCQDVDIAPILPDGAIGNVGVRPYAIDPDSAKTLWTLSERLTGVSFA